MSAATACAICKAPTSGRPCVRDKLNRVFHRDCYERALTRQRQKRQAAAPHPSVGRRLYCPNHACGRVFELKNPAALTAAIACPGCNAALVQEPPKPVERPLTPVPANDLSDLFDEEMPQQGSEAIGPKRHRMTQLLGLADAGRMLNIQERDELRGLISFVRAIDPAHCPSCQVGLPSDSLLCVHCGLHFARAERIKTAIKKVHPSIAKAQRELAEKEREAMQAGSSGNENNVAANIAGGILVEVLKGALGG